MQLNGRVAVVTGGTTGLGRAIATALDKAGATVVVAARTAGPGPEHHYLPVDVTAPESVRELMERVRDRFGGLHILVANAGISRPGPVAALPVSQWDEVLATNLTGVLHSIQAAIPLLRAAGSGRIITVSSALARRPMPGAAAYSAAKAGVEMLTRVCAAELAGDGITVNCLAPGIIDEGMGRALISHEPLWSRMRPALAMGRPGTGDEVGRAAVFLAATDSGYVNGQVLGVDGGLTW